MDQAIQIYNVKKKHCWCDNGNMAAFGYCCFLQFVLRQVKYVRGNITAVRVVKWSGVCFLFCCKDFSTRPQQSSMQTTQGKLHCGTESGVFKLHTLVMLLAFRLYCIALHCNTLH